MKPTLLLLAAGMGSRYGGLKRLQIRKKLVPLHRQKVNRLFRLVVIDLGF